MHTLSLVLALAAPPSADTWAGFRNDGGSRTTAADLPLQWSPHEQIAWRVSTSGYGQSSPVVWKDRIFLTSVAGAEKEKLIVAAFALQDGRKLWEMSFPASQKGKNNPMMSRAAGTPVVDAHGLYVIFESGDVIGLTHMGEVKWRRALAREFGEIKNNHGAGSSLAQTDTAVLALVDHQGPSYLIALSKSDGTTLWKADRPSRNSWTSPIVTQFNGQPTVVISSGGAATAYDAATGRLLWEFDGLKGNSIASPTARNELIVMAAGDDRMKPDAAASSASNCCVKLVEKAGQPSYEIVWRAKKVLGGTASPVIAGDYAYYADKNGLVHCLSLRSGEILYSERLDNQAWATPIVAGDRIYFFGKDGVTTVIKVGPEFDKLASNRLWTAEEFNARKEAEKKALPMGGPAPSGPAPSSPASGSPPAGAPPTGANPGDTARLAQSPNPPSKDAQARDAQARDAQVRDAEPKDGQPKGGPPPVSAEERQAAMYAAIGDVVYGVAAVDGAFIIRSGTELFCIRK